ncbi:MAG: RNA methyltransferase, partial [Candidatus Thermoplasmatota archaeon]
YELYGADIGEIHRYVKHVDAIVTDLPYGRAATTKGENKNNLYERAFQSISKILKKNRRAVIGSSSNALDEIGGNYLSFIETHILRVHKSLTRYFTVYKK